MLEHPEHVFAGANLLWIAQNLERMADHATLCEHVIAMETGVDRWSSCRCTIDAV
jgi:phosphate uptake regulator